MFPAVFAVEEQMELLKRVDQYSKNIAQYKRPTYNETEVRVDFVNPFFKLLGWDIDNEAGLPQHMREVIHEASVSVLEGESHKSKKPDYAFRVGTETMFYLETKKPSVNIMTDCRPAFQLRRYGWSGNLKISVLTNFTDLLIYDCTVRPVENDDVGVALIAHYSYSEYVSKFEEICGLLSKKSVISGEFKKKFGNIKGAFRREPFNEYFLKQIKEWRKALGEALVSAHKNIDAETLNICVQRLLNRIIFLRICEDRNLEKYETLKNITAYSELKQLFINADQKYDSGLFELLEEDRYYLPDAVLMQIFQSLYYPNNSYEFSVIDPYIIGQIYELFLDDILVIQEDGTVSSEEKPEAIEAQGAVNTPKNIADIIVEQTLAPLYMEKSPDEIEKYRIADICCGSGNFLLSAYEFIVNYYIEYFQKNEQEEAIRRGDIYLLPGASNFCLSYRLRRKILHENIFGVDIDPLAVEVAKFSLLLKALEGAPPDEVEAYTYYASNKILPNLDENIKNGNSLVDRKFAKFYPEIYQDLDLMNRVRIFDWEEEFGKAKFDAIIGNPPYIRVQNMVHYSSEEYAYYKSRFAGYHMSQSDLLDKYYLFIEKGMELLAQDGMMGYIIPNKFMTIQSGGELRNWLAGHHYVRRILHLGTFQVFKGRSTYTCILILSKQKQSYFEIGFVQDWSRFLSEHTVECDQYSADLISGQPWIFLPGFIKEAVTKCKDRCVPLKELAKLFVGVQTSADRIYIIHEEGEEEGYVTFTDKEGIRRKIEKGILRKSVYDAKLLKYNRIKANSYIIFPYQVINGKSELIREDEMRNRYPLAYEYLSGFRHELDKRNMTNRTKSNWYAYGRNQSIHQFAAGEHLIWPVLSLGSNYVYDDESVVFTGGGNGPFYGLAMKDSTQESIFYVQAILNHWLMEFLVKSKASMFRGGYYSHGKQFVAELPIYKIDFASEKEAMIHEKIVTFVKQIMELSEKEKTAGNSSARKVIHRTIEAIQREIDSMIDSLYGISGWKVEEENEKCGWV